MARDPGSVWAPLPESGSHGSYAKNKMIYHSTGDRATAKAIRSYFSGVTPNESTFVIGWGPDDPTLQLMDSAERADANGAANISGISVETVGTGDDPYNDWQIGELIRLGRWVHEVHGIPLQQIPDADGAGYGWHVMFGAPGPWTTARGKVCPGARRIQQLKQIVFPAIFSVQEDDMYGSSERNEVVGRLDRALGLLEAIHPAIASMQVGLMDPTSGVRTVVFQLAGRDPVEVDATELAQTLAPLLAPAFAERSGMTREDVEDVFRKVLGGLNDATSA